MKKIAIMLILITIFIQPFTSAYVIDHEDKDPALDPAVKQIRIKATLKDANGKLVPNEEVNIWYNYPENEHGETIGYIVDGYTNLRGIYFPIRKIDVVCEVRVFSWAGLWEDKAQWPGPTEEDFYQLSESDYPILEIELQFPNYVRTNAKAKLFNMLKENTLLSKLLNSLF